MNGIFLGALHGGKGFLGFLFARQGKKSSINKQDMP